MLIDLDKNVIIDRAKIRKPIDIKKNNRIIVKDSNLENIDTIDLETLSYILYNYKDYLNPVATSLYYPSKEIMAVISKFAPFLKVRFKTEKPGGSPIIPISIEDFFSGLAVFDEILSGIQEEWTDFQKYKYLYNELGKHLTYNLNVYENSTHSGKIEKLSRNIFTSIVNSSAICSSFAASYDYLCFRAGLESDILHEYEHDYVLITVDDVDYLVDPTFDASFIKFGMQSRNFAISKNEFIKNRHDLIEAEAANIEVGCLSREEVYKLDLSTGYLDDFNGTYQDEEILRIAKNLEGEDNFQKAQSLFSQLSKLLTVGHVGHHDYEKIVEFMIPYIPDKNFTDNFRFGSLLENDTEDMPRILVAVIKDNGIERRYKIADDLSSFQEFSESIDKQI